VRDVCLAVHNVIDTLNGAFGIGGVKHLPAKQHYQTFGESSIRAVPPRKASWCSPPGALVAPATSIQKTAPAISPDSPSDKSLPVTAGDPLP